MSSPMTQWTTTYAPPPSTSPERFVMLEDAAAWVGVPDAWLKEQTDAGRVPHLKAGDEVFYHCPTLLRALVALQEPGE